LYFEQHFGERQSFPLQDVLIKNPNIANVLTCKFILVFPNDHLSVKGFGISVAMPYLTFLRLFEP